jgi:hypothetical protein
MDWSWCFKSIFYFNIPQYGLVVVVYKYFLFQHSSIWIGRGGVQLYFLFQHSSIWIGRGGLKVFFISTLVNMEWSWWCTSIFYFNIPQYGLVVVVYKYFLFHHSSIWNGCGGLQVFFYFNIPQYGLVVVVYKYIFYFNISQYGLVVVI